MPTTSLLRRSGPVFCLAVLCTLGMVYYYSTIFLPRALAVRSAQGFGNGYSFGADFYPVWLTSREGLLHHRDPYSAAMTRQIQIGLFGRSLNANAPAEYRAFAYPFFANILLWPLAMLPFPVARMVMAILLPALTLISIFLWARTLRLSLSAETFALLALFTLSSYAVLEGVFAEQAGLLVGFFLSASLAALCDEKLFLSGSLMALTLIKPQMMALIAAYLLLWSFYAWRARWRFVAGFLFTFFLLAVSSLLVLPGWIYEWLHVIFGYRQYSTPPLVCYLFGDRLGTALCLALVCALLIGAIMLAWRARDASPESFRFSASVSLLLVITVLILLPGHAVYDHILLLPAVLLIALSWREFAAHRQLFRVLLGLTAIAVFWQWIGALIVIALRATLSPSALIKMVSLPIRTAASIPFAIFAILALMMWPRITRNNIAEGQELERN